MGLVRAYCYSSRGYRAFAGAGKINREADRKPSSPDPLATERDPLANGISMERILHEDGYSIRLRGQVVDVEMVELLMDDCAAA